MAEENVVFRIKDVNKFLKVLAAQNNQAAKQKKSFTAPERRHFRGSGSKSIVVNLRQRTTLLVLYCKYVRTDLQRDKKWWWLEVSSAFFLFISPHLCLPIPFLSFLKPTEQLYAIVWVTGYGNRAPGQSMLKKPHGVCVFVWGRRPGRDRNKHCLCCKLRPLSLLWVAWGFNCVAVDVIYFHQHQVFLENWLYSLSNLQCYFY